MDAYVEIWRPEGVHIAALGMSPVTVGKDPSNELVISDGTASRMHALLERHPAGWCIRDLSSRNGTFVNGGRISTDRPLHPGDEIRVGDTRIVFRENRATVGEVTQTAVAAPELTRRERDVLVALCRPVATGNVFTEPTSIREVARALVITEAAVKQHLANLYDKFGIHEPERRRVVLANEAVRRGAINLADLRARA